MLLSHIHQFVMIEATEPKTPSFNATRNVTRFTRLDLEGVADPILRRSQHQHPTL